MKRTVVPTKNVVAGLEAFDLIEHRRTVGTGLLLLVVGPAGCGKTSFGRLIVQQHGGALVRARQTWAPASAMNDSLAAIDEFCAGYRSAHEGYRKLVQQVQEKSLSCLVLDEADYLIRGGRHDLLNIFRDLSDETGAPVVFLSVQHLAKRLAAPTAFVETVASRLAAQVRFERPTMADAALLSRELLEGVSFERDLISFLLQAAGGSVRRLISLYADVEAAARSVAVEGNLSLARCEKLGFIARPTRAPAKTASDSNDENVDAHTCASTEKAAKVA